MSDDAAELTRSLRAVARKEQGAFRHVYRVTAARLFGICLRISDDRAVAENLLHDVYLAVWLKADRFDPARGSALAWLCALARHRAIDWRRLQPSRPTDGIEGLLDLVDPGPAADIVAAWNEQRRRLIASLQTLDADTRAAIEQAFFDDRTHGELAELFDVPLGTMKSRIRRGLLQLRGQLGQDAGPDADYGLARKAVLDGIP